MSNEVPQEDWYDAFRYTYATYCDKASALDFPDDPRVKARLVEAVRALTDVTTELTVIEAESQIRLHQEGIAKQRDLLKALGR